MNFKTKVRRVNKDKLISGHMYRVWLSPDDTVTCVCLYLNKTFYAINNPIDGSFSGGIVHCDVTGPDKIEYQLYKIDRPLGLCDKIEDILRPDLELIETREEFIFCNIDLDKPYLISRVKYPYKTWVLIRGYDTKENVIRVVYSTGETEDLHPEDILEMEGIKE